MKIKERKALAEVAKDFTGTDCKFVTLTLPRRLPPLIRRNIGGKYVRKFYNRTQQALTDSGGGKLSAIVIESKKVLESKGRVFHYHLLLRGDGLGRINTEKMVKRWEQITGLQVKASKEVKLTKVRVPDPDKTYMKDGVVHTAWEEVPRAVVISEVTQFKDAGTCDVKDAQPFHARYITGFKNLEESFFQNPANMGILPSGDKRTYRNNFSDSGELQFWG